MSAYDTSQEPCLAYTRDSHSEKKTDILQEGKCERLLVKVFRYDVFGTCTALKWKFVIGKLLMLHLFDLV